MYFNKFPNILYDFNVNGEDVVIQLKDITRNIRFRRDILSNITIYDEYDVMDGERPEHVAEKVYGNAQYHWIVMLMNDVYDYKSDWLLSHSDLENYITYKYGTAKYNTHHYIDSNGFVVNSDVGTSVSNYDYEYQLNETKRRIKLVPPYLIDKILSDYNHLM